MILILILMILVILIIIAKPWAGVHHYHGASDHGCIFCFLKNLPELWSIQWSHSWKKFNLQNSFSNKKSFLWWSQNCEVLSIQCVQTNQLSFSATKLKISLPWQTCPKTKYFYTSEPNQCQLSICNLPFWLFVTAKLNIFIPVNFLRSQSNMSCSKTSPKLP